MKLKNRLINFFRYLFHYSNEEKWIVWIIFLLAIIWSIIFLEPLILLKSTWQDNTILLKSKDFWQGFWDKFAIFFISTVTLTVFLKRFFDEVDRKKFYYNLKMLCISHKIHEVLIFCLEYFDKLSFLLDNKVNDKSVFEFNFKKQILNELPFLDEIKKLGLTTDSVDDFWHNLDYEFPINWKSEKDTKEKPKKENVRKLLLNQDFFYKTRKDDGRYIPQNNEEVKTWKMLFIKIIEQLRKGLDIFNKHKDNGSIENKELFLKLLQTTLIDSWKLNHIRLNESELSNIRNDIDTFKLAKKWYIWNYKSTSEAKNDITNIAGMIEYLRVDIYKKIYTYSDRKSADWMDIFLKLTTILDRIDWKINIKNKDIAEKEEQYRELFLWLESDFVFLFFIAYSIYKNNELFLESYAYYEKLILSDIENNNK